MDAAGIFIFAFGVILTLIGVTIIVKLILDRGKDQ